MLVSITNLAFTDRPADGTLRPGPKPTASPHRRPGRFAAPGDGAPSRTGRSSGGLGRDHSARAASTGTGTRRGPRATPRGARFGRGSGS